MGYVSGQDGVIYRTENMGDTWQYIGSCFLGGDLSSLFFTKRDTGFIHMFGGDICRVTIDSFLNVHCTCFGDDFGYNFWGTGALRFSTEQSGFVAGGNGKFARTSDGGNTWQAFNGDTNIFVLCAAMSDTSHSVIAGENGKVSVTTNGGASWSATTSISQHHVLDIAFVNNLKGYAVGGADATAWQAPNTSPKGLIWKTDDGGYTWSVEDSSWNYPLMALYIINDSLAFAVGYGGIIFKNANLLYDRIKEIITNENTISLSPNPATTEIRIESTAFKMESLEIYDVLGNRCQRAEGRRQKEIKIDVSKLSPGIYFVKVKNDKGEWVGKFVKK